MLQVTVLRNGKKNMSDFKTLHPICLLVYFIAVIVLLLLCSHPLMMLIGCIAAAGLLVNLELGSLKNMLKWMLPICLFIIVANPLLNHRGVTRLFFAFGQWVTLEAVCYGAVSGLSLMSLILWFACYQKVMTSDKFLYLFGKIAPASALMVTMALAFVPKLQNQLQQIQECQKMLSGEKETVKGKMAAAIHHVSTLIGWSLENAVEQVDSMKARGYGIKRRSTFHLFRFGRRDMCFLAVVICLAGSCLIFRSHGYGVMEFYPRIVGQYHGVKDSLFYILFLVLAGIPGVMGWKEKLLWGFYNSNP